jgi:hypothetical protein
VRGRSSCALLGIAREIEYVPILVRVIIVCRVSALVLARLLAGARVAADGVGF